MPDTDKSTIPVTKRKQGRKETQSTNSSNPKPNKIDDDLNYEPSDIASSIWLTHLTTSSTTK